MTKIIIYLFPGAPSKFLTQNDRQFHFALLSSPWQRGGTLSRRKFDTFKIKAGSEYDGSKTQGYTEVVRGDSALEDEAGPPYRVYAQRTC